MPIEEVNLGAITKTAREKKKLTQEILSEKVLISVRQLQNIENEKSDPRYNVLYRIVRELEIPLDSIFYPEKEPADQEFKYLVHILQLCNKSNIRAITALSEALYKEQSSQQNA